MTKNQNVSVHQKNLNPILMSLQIPGVYINFRNLHADLDYSYMIR